MPFITVNGAKLFYLEKGSGPLTLFFGHGTLISSNIWRDFYFPLLPAEWHALAPDFRGHGASNAVRTGCNFVRMAEDVAAMIQAKNLGRVVYVGLSMGGGVGLQLALSHPELLRGLVLLSPVTGLGPLGNPAFSWLGKYMAGKRWLLRLGMSSASTRRPSPAALDKVVEEALLVRSQTLREYLAPGNRFQGIERLSQLKVPALLLIGLRDRVIPVKQQLLLGRSIPGCEVHASPEHGHALAAENPEWVLARMRKFVAKLADHGSS